REPVRVVYDYRDNNQGQREFRFSGYTEKHDCKGLPCVGESNYNNIHSVYQNDLNRSNDTNYMNVNQATRCELRRRKGDEEVINCSHFMSMTPDFSFYFKQNLDSRMIEEQNRFIFKLGRNEICN
ncbi:hypothetical protein, partial [Corallococcus sp. AB038B]|uniref:hypothetical protein n=1 Tax=Corallococcus sp. AB038B TaxID=2316718 RepID=UPI001F25B5A4